MRARGAKGDAKAAGDPMGNVAQRGQKRSPNAPVWTKNLVAERFFAVLMLTL
jgi:hypothetical protein